MNMIIEVIKKIGILKTMPEEKQAINFTTQLRIENRLRIVQWSLRKVENLVKLERYAEAESTLNEVGDNLHMWANN